MDYTHESFADQDIHLDGNSFNHCHFEGCQLIYHGENPTSVAYCQVVNCGFLLADGARRTVDFLRGLYHSGLSEVVEAFIKDIREKPPSP